MNLTTVDTGLVESLNDANAGFAHNPRVTQTTCLLLMFLNTKWG